MKLVLVDRDGVINQEIPGYVTSPEEFLILPQALEAFALLKKNGFTAVVVTNQSVVGRGIISPGMLHAIHGGMQQKVASCGGEIAEVFVCTDSPENATFRRKPKPGMLLEALEKYNARPEETCFIGDALTDMEAAYAAGCQRYLVMTGKGRESMKRIPDYLQPVAVHADILEAAREIINR